MARPTKYQEAHAEQARKLCLLGYTDAELADFFEVSEATINNWKLEHPEFLESIKKGKAVADGDVASNLYHRAMGYTAKEKREEKTAEGFKEVDAEKHIPGDVTAMIFWLKNRQKDKWREKQDVNHTSDDGSMTPKAPVYNVVKSETQ
ncbi:terminase [Klebsiella aerogenes]|uniref:terminase n=1 Tax=Klebsiella aerogenes TaxID=548 RepID=UPI00291BC200|nr:terminase [Klebsiella aerogenes]MDU9141234.1 terminase [Klebsiella aerogenes]